MRLWLFVFDVLCDAVRCVFGVLRAFVCVCDLSVFVCVLSVMCDVMAYELSCACFVICCCFLVVCCGCACLWLLNVFVCVLCCGV